MKAIGYVRVSSQEQADSGLGLDAQRAAIRADVERRGWNLVQVFEDAGASGKDLNRPGISAALAAVESKDGADVLIVAKRDRLSRSLLDFASLMERARRKGWSIVALDLGVDTSTPAGEMMANVLATFAQFERRLIGQRTRDALAIVRQNGSKSGRPIGNPNFVPIAPEIEARIIELRGQGESFAGVARILNNEGVPTSRGGAGWAGQTVSRITKRSI